MGRLLKRVPLDFDAPLKQVWNGYVNPFYVACSENCEGGYSSLYRSLQPIVRGIMGSPELSPISSQLSGDRSGEYSHIVNFGKTFGLPDDFMICPVCSGHGIDPLFYGQYDTWEKVEPPTGDGYQLWENRSEGSPISPVFHSLGELATWAEENATTFGSHKADKKTWIRILAGEESFIDLKDGNVEFIN